MEASSRVYDLFLSHRSPDKKDFCAFLKEALQRAGVHMFVDELDLVVGAPDAAWTTMRTALQGARYMLPVISEGFCNSRWCMDELALMMQSPAKVMPVFFYIPRDKDKLADLLLRYAARLDAHAHLAMHPAALHRCSHAWLSYLFGHCRGRLKDNSPDKLQQWAGALKDVTTKAGWRGELHATG